MDYVAFYKGIFEGELNRRKDLDNSVNIPIGLVSLITGMLYYIFNKVDFSTLSVPTIILLVILGLSLSLLIASILFLAKSYNNIFRGFKYMHLPITGELRAYQQSLISYKEKVEKYCKDLTEYNSNADETTTAVDEVEEFTDYLIDKYIEYSDNHIKINDDRVYYLYWAKTLIITSIFLTSIGLAITIYKTL